MSGSMEAKVILHDWLKLVSDQSKDCLQVLSNSEDIQNIEKLVDKDDFEVETVEYVAVDKWYTDESKYQDMKSGNY